jgi:uncharacterized protein
VRHHGEIARIELPVDELGRAVELRERIIAGVTAAGYRYVTLDLAGFRRGPGEMLYALGVVKAGSAAGS